MANQKVEPGSSAGARGSCIPASRPPAPGRSLAYLQDVDVERVRNIGPRQAGMLAKSGIHSVADLLQHFPHRYLDRSLVVPIAGLPVDAEATLIAEVVRSYRPRVSGRRGPREVLRVTVQDSHPTGSGSERGLGRIQRMEITFFNQPFRGRQLLPGTVAAVSIAEGDTFRRGDVLVVLEAMKVEIAIRAEGAGTVRTVTVRPGDRVEEGVILVTVAALSPDPVPAGG